MKLRYIRHETFAIGGDVSNAAVSFSSMTASAVVVGLETSAGLVQGLGFDSYGRYAHGALLAERFIPRIWAAGDDLLAGKRGAEAALAVSQAMLRDEKGGGHGERAGAIGLLDSALWDALAKAEAMPLWTLLAREFGHCNDGGLPPDRSAVYASGGHYRPGDDDVAHLAEEVERSFASGFGWYKLKVGGASPAHDDARLNAALKVARDPALIAVDANCALSGADGMARLRELSTARLRWIEEPLDPLDYHGLAEITRTLPTPVAVGENVFSAPDLSNLLRYGGLRSGHDVLQMDLSLAYGITEFSRMLRLAEAAGWRRRDFIPHAGHQLALHASAGLGLGGHEAASATDGPFGGMSSDVRLEDGVAQLTDAPGAGIERKPALYRFFDTLI